MRSSPSSRMIHGAGDRRLIPWRRYLVPLLSQPLPIYISGYKIPPPPPHPHPSLCLPIFDVLNVSCDPLPKITRLTLQTTPGSSIIPLRLPLLFHIRPPMEEKKTRGTDPSGANAAHRFLRGQEKMLGE